MGPKENTCVNFWRMILQEKVLAIVMMTGLIEKGTEKCARYWPHSKETMTFGALPHSINITAGDSVACVGFQRTRLRVKCGGAKTDVMHWWYTGWPDHGVPQRNKRIFTDEVNHS